MVELDERKQCKTGTKVRYSTENSTYKCTTFALMLQWKAGGKWAIIQGYTLDNFKNLGIPPSNTASFFVFVFVLNFY